MLVALLPFCLLVDRASSRSGRGRRITQLIGACAHIGSQNRVSLHWICAKHMYWIAKQSVLILDRAKHIGSKNWVFSYWICAKQPTRPICPLSFILKFWCIPKACLFSLFKRKCNSSFNVDKKEGPILQNWRERKHGCGLWSVCSAPWAKQGHFGQKQSD